MEPALGGARRVYVSPDADLAQISFAALPIDGAHRLIDRYDVRIVSSTRDLLARAQPSAGEAVLVGNPLFTLSAARQRAVAAAPRQTRLDAVASAPDSAAAVALAGAATEVRGGPLRPLPDAESEVRTVGEMLSRRGWSVEAFTGENALKEVVLGVHHPRVLHLATHGYLMRDVPAHDLTLAETSSGRVVRFDDPMRRSLLFFAGAARTWTEHRRPVEGLDDGILTAYEAAALDLRGTELVVLSACDSGLGRVEAGEGVLGLRRAFQEAGAQAVLMSMWEVPSAETAELLRLFYRNWLRGADKYTALREAQRTMRRRIIERTGRDDPYAWAGFVLVGRYEEGTAR